jgi:hypothetical protein
MRLDDLPSPWREFLSDVDKRLPSRVDIHCLGGFVVMALYRRPRRTGDVDYIEVVPLDGRQVLEDVAGVTSKLAKKYHLHFQSAAIADRPEGYEDRLIPLFPGVFMNLRMFALEPHDLALSKLTRNHPVDREDVEYLAKTVPLSPDVLRQRYADELRPIVMGDPKRHDLTLKIWIESYFPSRDSEANTSR